MNPAHRTPATVSRHDPLLGATAESRENTAGYFPLPPKPDAADYGLSEAGEWIDADLRAGRPDDKRNNAKEHSARKEAGQMGYMIFSAMMQSGDSTPAANPDLYRAIVNLALYRIHGVDGFLIFAAEDWIDAVLTAGWEPAELIAETCAAFERKHIPQPATP